MTDARRIDALGRLALFMLVAAFAFITARQVVRPVLVARQEERSFREALAILAETEGDVDRLNAEIRFVSERVAECEALLPPQASLDAFLEQVGLLASRHHIHIERLTPCEVGDHRLYREQSVDLRATGGFLSLYHFLRDLEHGPRLSRVEQLNLGRGADDSNCAAELRLALYFAPAGEKSS
jgi:Tfp pilus assembly protein PilO